MKKEISDHLAKTFFENKSRSKKKDRHNFLIPVTAVLITGLVFGAWVLVHPKTRSLSALGERVALGKYDGPYTLRFDFTNSLSPVQSLGIELPDFDLNSYHYLKFSARLNGTGIRQLGAFKISLMNRRKETAHTYTPQINQSWKTIKIPLSQFEALHDRAGFLQLSFTLEEWNAYPRKGEVLIEGIEFSKN